jgi:N-dimethylarginine dimethylaminohydrolase
MSPSAQMLPWGFRYLMCPPDFFTVSYEINPWMHLEEAPDPERAHGQFDALVSAIRRAGGEVDLLDPVEGLPDLVFTANAGLATGRTFVASRFRHAERAGETQIDTAYFSTRGYQVVELPGEGHWEGAGDSLPVYGTEKNPTLLCGYRFRSDIATHASLSRLLLTPVRSVELVDPRLYHLDLCFCPVDRRHALVAECGIDAYGMRVVSSLVSEPFVLSEDEALSFCANSIVVGDVVIMPSCPPRVGRALESWGMNVEVVEVSEFIRAGGGVRCLTLPLDLDLGASLSS